MAGVAKHTWVKIARQDAMKDQGGRCLYCFERLSYKSATAEHRKARSSGGTDAKVNIGATCQPCNSLKGRMGEKGFLKRLKSPAHGDGIEWWMAWSRRRINLAAVRARTRIIRFAGLRDVDP
jgi:5-methylcytosine-specific restriction endonuclease McrA